MHKYDVGLNEERPDVLNMMLADIPAGSSVLEMGCGNGRLTRLLGEKKQCAVTVIERDRELYAMASAFAADGRCADINALHPEDFEQGSFDAVVFADVLEHLPDPERILKMCSHWLAPAGRVFISIPNAAHNDVLLSLAEERLDYTETGLMDRTHIHFFTYGSAVSMFRAAGFRIAVEDCVSRPMGTTELFANREMAVTELVHVLAERARGEVYQYYFVLERAEKAETAETAVESRIDAHADMVERRLYADCGQGYSEDHMLSFFASASEPYFCVSADLPAGTRVVRFDPVLGRPCRIEELMIYGGGRRLCAEKAAGDVIDLPSVSPSLYITDLEGVMRLTISGRIRAGFDLVSPSRAELLRRELEEVRAEDRTAVLSGKIRELQAAAEAAEREKEALKASLASALTSIDEGEAEQVRLTGIIGDKQKALDEALTELNGLQGRRDAYEERIASLREAQAGEHERAEMLEEIRQSLTSSLAAMTEQKEARAAELLRAERELAALRETSAIRENENQTLKDRLDETVSQARAREEAYAGELKEAREAAERARAESARLSEELARQTEDVRERLIRTEADCQRLAEEKEDFAEALVETEKEAAQLRAQISDSKAGYQEAVRLITEEQSRREEAEERAGRAEKLAEDAEKRAEDAEKRAESAQEAAAGEREKNAALVSRLEAVQAVSEKRDDNISHLLRVKSANEDELSRARRRIEELTALIGVYEHSTSWRVTAPLRSLMAVLKGRRQDMPERDYPRLPDHGGASSEKGELSAGEAASSSTAAGETGEKWPYTRVISDYHPLVSVIVPNYNHAPYLRERLDSVYGQTYDRYEVLLLDDCSTDDSRTILEEYAARYPEKTKCLFNEQNCGFVMKQWNRGLEAARGELIWIAESDDVSDPAFLSVMVDRMACEAVMLAFCRSDFMQDGKRTWTTEEYLSDLTDISFAAPFVRTADEIVRSAFFYKNIIPNVSSCVFRNRGLLSESLMRELEGVRLSGDWLFYLETIRGGLISYTNEVTNYYRVHAKSTSLKIQQSMAYYDEYEKVMRYAARYYPVPEGGSHEVLEKLRGHYRAIHACEDASPVEEHFSPDRIRESGHARRLHVIMACYSLQPGGGETFSINLANQLRKMDVTVSLLDLNMEKYDPRIRELVDPAVPVLTLRSPDDLFMVLHRLGGDVIHSHHGSADQAIALWLADGRLPMRQLITLHGMYDMMEEGIFRHTMHDVDPVCRRFVYIADKNLEPFEKYGFYRKDRFVKITNGLPAIAPGRLERRDFGLQKSDFVLVLASRGIPEKGWAEAVRAVEIANKKSRRRICLLVLGDGEMKARLEAEPHDNVHFLGVRSNVRDFYAMADCGLVPTYFKGESCPLVVIECLQSGTPVIATDIAEVRNELTDREGNLAGVLLTLRSWSIDPEEIASAMVALANDRRYYRRLKSRCASAAEKFDMASVAGNYIDVYEDVTRE